MTTRNRTKTVLAFAVVAMATLVLASTSTHAAVLTIGTSAPAIDGLDIANLAAGTAGEKLWTDTRAIGQSFTMGSQDAVLNAITLQSWSGSLATKSYTLTIGGVSGTSYSVFATESGIVQSGDSVTGDYWTFALGTPVTLSANTLYGFDLAMNSSTSGWQSGIPYRSSTANSVYTDGQAFRSQTNGQSTSTIGFINADKVFHLDMSAVGGGPAPPPEATIIKPVSVSTSITGDAGSSHLYLLDDNAGFAAAGLQRPVGTGVTLNTGDPLSDALATLAERSGGGHAESWTRPTGSGLPEFVFDITGGGDTPVESILLWQYGNNGGGAGRIGNATKDFRVILHTEAEGDTFDFGTETADIDDFMEAYLAATTDSNIAQLFDFASVQNARYAALIIDDNYLGEPGIVAGGDRYGLGEVRFVAPAILAAVPEPSTFALAALGLLGVGWFGWRRKR